ncbi:hypothetical protein C3F09_10690 [candidate division GN15 bacterium]|uniref:Uncharacterized protein n=1 Tax=candidate division GN15 bacterium TaxID=2072418 RepID=A0A855WWF9_9BACT|nr:MAG: hypothetical protein C3F09_10690 [candidate division GN15 bacterium]
MSYTTVDRLRSYLAANYAVAERVEDLPVTPRDSQPVRFWGCAIEAGSLKAKSLQSLQPISQSITVAIDGNILTASPIARGSVVAASDSSLGTVYVENLDYIVDYVRSTMHCKDSGAISVGQTLVVWHVPMHVYSEGEDYSVDYETAGLRRSVGGTMASGETVYLDFVPVFAAYDESFLAVAVNEANSRVEREVDPDREFSADETLSAAATYLALEIVCHSAAARELSSGRATDRVALAWLKLAEGYRARSSELLSAFRPPVPGTSHPTHS